MRNIGLAFGLLLSLSLLTGCGTQSSAPTVAEETQKLLPTATYSPPTQTVVDFMMAMIRGDDMKIRTLLTPTARKVGEEQGVPFAPPASGTSTFSIDKTVDETTDLASVYTTLTDTAPDGEKESAEIIWKVVKTSEGWRVSSAAVALFEGQPKTIIDFENPEATQRAIAEAEAKSFQKIGNQTTPENR